MPEKKRALGEDTASRIAAGAVVVPFISKIRPMVDRAVLLEAIAGRDANRGSDLRQEAAMLAVEAREDLEHLDQQLVGVPPSVLAHSRISDTRKALVAIMERFERARVTL